MSRYYGATVPLDGGKILLIGGIHLGPDGFRYLTDVELYDPATRTWSTRAPMHTDRGIFVATRLLDGRVLVTKGNNGRGTINDTTEIYDPVADAWSDAAPLGGEFLGFSAAATLPNGRAYFFGESTKVYSPGTNTWSDAASPFLVGAAVELANGDVYAAGRDAAALLRADTETWTMLPPFPGSFPNVNLALLRDGRVFASEWSGYDDSHAAGVFDFTSNAWTLAPPTAHPLKGAAVGALPDGRVAVLGGFDAATQSKTGALALYNTQTNAWQAGPALAAARSGATAVATLYGVLFIGGSGDQDAIATADEFAYPNPDQFTVGDARSKEGGPIGGKKSLSFRVQLPAPATKALRLTVVTANGTATDDDYSAGAYSVVIGAGKTFANVVIAISGDIFYEPNETMTIEVRDPATHFTATATGTILNDDPELIPSPSGSPLG